MELPKEQFTKKPSRFSDFFKSYPIFFYQRFFLELADTLMKKQIDIYSTVSIGRKNLSQLFSKGKLEKG